MADLDVAFTTLNPDSGERFQRLREALGVQSFGINLITLQPGQRGRIHRHTRQEEVFVVIEGELTLGLEGDEHVLGVGAAARVGPSVRRQITNWGPGRVVLLALGGEGEHVGKDGLAWAAWDEAGEGRGTMEVPAPADVTPRVA